MENKNTHYERYVKSVSRTSKQVTAANREDARAQKPEKEQTPVKATNETRTNVKEYSKESTGIKITETYDEVLDLRKSFVVNKNNRRYVVQNFTTEVPLQKNQGLNKLPELPKMRCKIMSLCSVQNSKKISETINAKATDIIAERIVSKQQELLSKEKPNPKLKSMKGPLLPVRLNEKCVAQRIFNTQKELNKKEKLNKRQQIKIRNVLPKIPENTRSGILKPIQEASQSSIRSLKKDKADPKYKPRFQLSTRAYGSRTRINTTSIQVDLEKPSILSLCTQTADDLKCLKDEKVQATKKSTTNAKKMQTRMFKTNTIETSPFVIVYPEKYTNTISDFPRSEQSTQMYEHFTLSDLFCLDWVNKHLFTVNLNPFNIVIDDKIKEASEVASKSTLMSELKAIGL